MNLTVTIDWKFAVAVGISVAGIILAVKMDASSAERVASCAVDACREYATAVSYDA